MFFFFFFFFLPGTIDREGRGIIGVLVTDRSIQKQISPRDNRAKILRLLTFETQEHSNSA